MVRVWLLWKGPGKWMWKWRVMGNDGAAGGNWGHDGSGTWMRVFIRGARRRVGWAEGRS